MITVIIPTFNLGKLQGRGWERVRFSMLSLAKQPCRVILVDGSNNNRDRLDAENVFDSVYNEFEEGWEPLIHHIGMQEFNKPVLLNYGIALADDYVLCTDADYLFPPKFIATCDAWADRGHFLLSRVRMLTRQETISEERIREWTFIDSEYPFNEYGELANGGVQLFHKSFFDLSGGYDERMSGWGGMDNDMVNRAKLAGLTVEWMKGIEPLHQYHPVNKMSNNTEKAKSRRNWKLRDEANYVNWREAK